MISGNLVLILILIAVLVYGVFFSPLPVPSWVRTVFAIVLVVLAFVWLLNLLNVVAL